MKKDKWIQMPHATHFIGSASCHFVMATYVGKYIVSTVGEYYPSYAKDKPEEIGIDRILETMVFKAVKSDCKGCKYEIKSGENIDFAGYKTSEEAVKGHWKLCNKWSKK